MRKIGLLTLLIYLIQTVHGNDNNTLTTTNELFQLKLDDLVLVNALAYNKSGNINALSWSLTYLPNASNATLQYQTQYYLLVAASVTTFQVWNGTIVRSEGKKIKVNFQSLSGTLHNLFLAQISHMLWHSVQTGNGWH